MNTPFIDFKATEISPEKQKCFFVEPDHIGRLISPKASLVFGERGSGKTTILKHLEKTFNSSKGLEYVGVYYRFETAYVKALNNPEITADQNIAAFSQSIAAILGKLLCYTLEEVKKEQKIDYMREKAICRKVMADIELQVAEKVDTFDKLANVFEHIRKKTLINLQNGKSICYFEYTTFVSEFCEELRKEKVFSNTCFCVLLDEYENLTRSQQRVVNSFIKGSSYVLTYKVCMRPEGFLTKDTVAEKEQLISGHDYEEFDYVKDIVGSEKKVKEHLRRICANRLEYFYNQQQIHYNKANLEIDSYLEITDDETDIESWERIEEYKENMRIQLKEQYPAKKTVIDKISRAIDLKLIFILYEKKRTEEEIFSNLGSGSEKYKNWLHNYKKNIIFQISSECEQSRKYCGFNTFIKLSNSNTRTMLEILHYSFGDYDKLGQVYGTININRQTKAVNRVSEASFNQIDYIPVNGYKTKNLVNALGNLFADCIQDQRIKKFEANSFSIITTSKLDKDMEKELRMVLRDAVVWGVLIPSKVNKVKNSGDIVLDGRDYMLHPIFAPYFKISYRKRQKCELKDVEIYSMLSRPKSRNQIRDISRKVNSEYIQQELEFI